MISLASEKLRELPAPPVFLDTDDAAFPPWATIVSAIESRVNDTEINRSGPTYTIDTVLEIKKSHPDDALVLIVGTDAYAQFEKWHRHEELAKLVEIIVIDRPEFPGASTLDIGALNVSATAVRP